MTTAEIRKKYDEALAGLATNIWKLFDFESPVLCEGGMYAGAFLECAPVESITYGRHVPEIAIANHDVFFHHQREDGYIPFCIRRDRVWDWQVQTVDAVAATALEAARMTQNEAFMARAYKACARYDEWLMRSRNTRGTGLCEAFCEFDTGHDHTPRFEGLPKTCPNGDPAACSKPGELAVYPMPWLDENPPQDFPAAVKLPFLAPDLSAAVYGGRRALAEMADLLGKPIEAEQWREKAEEIRQLIFKYCYDPEDDFFYDLDAQNNFVRVRGDIIHRLYAEHVLDQATFDRIYARHTRNPESFWTPYPLPSIAMDDPKCNKDFSVNGWTGPSTALTALRTTRWMEHYGKHEDFRYLMSKWVEAIGRCDQFRQQLDPYTGECLVTQGYSPSMCVYVEFVERLGLLTGDSEKTKAEG
jgi:hypothetical protein